MQPDNENVQHEHAILSNTIGRVLRRISRADYFIDGKPNENHVGPLELEFERGYYLSFDLLSDGQIRVEAAPLTFPEPQEGFLTWKRVVLSDRSPWSVMVGRAVVDWAIGCIRHKQDGPMQSFING